MKYLLMTYGVLMILFSGALMAKADEVSISGNFSLGLENFFGSCLGVCNGSVDISSPMGSAVQSNFVQADFHLSLDGHYSFLFFDVFGNKAVCPPVGPSCFFGEATGVIRGVVPTPIHLPGKTASSAVGVGQADLTCIGTAGCPEGGSRRIVSVSGVFDSSLNLRGPNPGPGTVDVTFSLSGPVSEPGPVPEPGSFLLFATGLVPLLWIFRRQLRPEGAPPSCRFTH
jgi:hypothetical protein